MYVVLFILSGIAIFTLFGTIGEDDKEYRIQMAAICIACILSISVITIFKF
jgi:hypothetical protein